jgi:uncharacterized protein YkwD
VNFSNSSSSFSNSTNHGTKKLFSLTNLALALMLVFALCAGIFGTTGQASAAPFGDTSFEKIWQQADQPIAAGQANRSWLWGAAPNWGGYEGYDQARPNGNRMVQYFDKSRMEINDPNADRNSQWFVSNGLLTTELVSGLMQVGDNRFENRAPAGIPVAGDLHNNTGPTYAALAGLTITGGNFAGNRTGQAVNEGVTGSGQVSRIQPPIATNYAYYEPQTKHNVPAVLWNWMQNIPGSNWTFALGYPISEAYWSQFNVGGQNKMVLVQLFQRRVLTYTPSNSAAWQVEMGNIGLHYFNWRYNGQSPAPAQVASAPAPAPVASPLDSEEQAFIQTINNYRRANGLGDLTFQANIERAANWMSQDMAEKNYFSHTDSQGRDPFKRMADFDYKGGWMGENIAAGKSSGVDTFTQFKNSPGHNANMLKPQFTRIGVARHHLPGSTYGWYWTVDFGD